MADQSQGVLIRRYEQFCSKFTTSVEFIGSLAGLITCKTMAHSIPVITAALITTDLHFAGRDFLEKYI